MFFGLIEPFAFLYERAFNMDEAIDEHRELEHALDLTGVRVHRLKHLVIIFFNDTATTEIYTLSLHDALPICFFWATSTSGRPSRERTTCQCMLAHQPWRSEEHTSELQSQSNLVCRLLLEKKEASTEKSMNEFNG